MAQAGGVIHNPAMGETVTFLVTASDSDGKLPQLDMTAEKSSAPTHVHPKIRERWELRARRAHFQVGKDVNLLDAPAQLEVPASTPHRFWSDDPIHTDVEGMPKILRSAVIARAPRRLRAPVPVARRPARAVRAARAAGSRPRLLGALSHLKRRDAHAMIPSTDGRPAAARWGGDVQWRRVTR
jgi:hypothetical protein